MLRRMSSLNPFPSGSPLHPPAPSRPNLPAWNAAGPQVNAQEHVEPGTGLALALTIGGALLLANCILFAFAGMRAVPPQQQASNGAGGVLGALFSILLIAVALLVPAYFAVRKAKAILRATALRAGPRQFPELHACAAEFARRLGLAEAPELFVLDAGQVNAFALRFRRRNMVVLSDETVAACLEGRSCGALAFVIAHEIAHVALGHTSWWRLLARRNRKLSRLDECSADNVACALVGARDAALDGVLLLSAGPRLLPFVDRAAALEQAAEIVADPASARVERGLTHPLTLRRLQRVAQRFGEQPFARRAAA